MTNYGGSSLWGSSVGGHQGSLSTESQVWQTLTQLLHLNFTCGFSMLEQTKPQLLWPRAGSSATSSSSLDQRPPEAPSHQELYTVQWEEGHCLLSFGIARSLVGSIWKTEDTLWADSFVRHKQSTLLYIGPVTHKYFGVTIWECIFKAGWKNLCFLDVASQNIWVLVMALSASKF